MSFLTQLLLTVLFGYLTYLLTPKPKGPEKSTLEDFDIPKATEGDPIPKVFGTVTIRNPQVAWYGDFRLTPIKQKGGKK